MDIVTFCGEITVPVLMFPEKMRGSNRVQALAQGFASGDVSRSREDLRLPPTPPPHNRSPDNTDIDDHK